MPRWVRALRQASKVNCVPWSEVTVKVTAKTRDPALDESLDDRLRRCVRDGDSFRPAGGSVDHHQEVFKPAVWREWTHDIDMNMAETCWRGQESGGRTDWCVWRSCLQRRRDTVVPSKVRCGAYPAKRMIWR